MNTRTAPTWARVSFLFAGVAGTVGGLTVSTLCILGTDSYSVAQNSCPRFGSTPVALCLSIGFGFLLVIGRGPLGGVLAVGLGALSVALVTRAPGSLSSWALLGLSAVALLSVVDSLESASGKMLSETYSQLKKTTSGQRWKLLLVLAVAVACEREIQTIRLGAELKKASGLGLVEWFSRRSLESKDKRGPLMVEIFSDFQCPFCRQNVPKLTEVARLFGVKTKLVDFPLDSNCNKHVPPPGLHGAACEAAVAARIVAAAMPAEETSFKSWLFSNQNVLNRPLIAGKLTEIGLAGKLAEADTYRAGVLEDIERAALLGVTATPTVAINGIPLPTSAPEEFEKLLAHLQQTPAHEAGVPVR